MAREDTFKKRSTSFLDEKMDIKLKAENLDSPIDTVDREIVIQADEKPTKSDKDREEVVIDLSSLPKKDEEKSKAKKGSAALKFMTDKPKTINKTLVIREDIVKAFDGMFEDSRGKKIPGVRGMMSKVATNALIKELVELEVLDEDFLDELEEY